MVTSTTQGLLHPQGFFEHFHACLQISTLRGRICQFVQSGCNARMATVSVKDREGTSASSGTLAGILCLF